MANGMLGAKNPGMLLAAAAIGLSALAAPAWGGAAGGSDIAVVVHPNNSLNDISLAELARIYLRRSRQWPDGSPIMLFNRKPGSAERVAFDLGVLKMSSEKAAAHWIDQRIRGQGEAPRGIGSGLLMQSIVAGQPAAIGYLRADEVNKKVKVLKVEGRRPGEKGYPIKQNKR
jgi:ABC-type phosphate transport system substrate-binding protein